MSQATSIAVAGTKQSLVTKFAQRFGVDANKIMPILKATAFRQRKADTIITDEQMAALMIVADQYGLNPFTKEIFAYEDKGAIVPVVSVDGWIRIINDHPAMDGIEYRYSDVMDTPAKGKKCPQWCEAVITRKDRSKPIVVREYLDEVYVNERNNYSGPWQSHTKRMLRHKTTIQGGRVAFGFSGIYDEDEASRIIQAQELPPARIGNERPKTLADAMGVRKDEQPHSEEVHDADFRDSPRVATGPDITAQEVHDAIAAATTRKDLDDAFDLVKQLHIDYHADMTDLYNQRALDLVGGE
jgi:phage recombination protein Bet